MKPDIIHSQCEKTKECKNDQCFFRQRDIFGRHPFLHLNDDALAQANIAIEKEHGQAIFPSLHAEVGTNVIIVLCKDFKT